MDKISLEKKILSTMMTNEDSLYEGILNLSEDDFSPTPHKIIFNHLNVLNNSDDGSFIVKAIQHFSSSSIIKEIGFNAYTDLKKSCDQSMFSVSAFPKYLHSLKKASAQMKLKKIAAILSSEIDKREDDVDVLIAETQNMLSEVTDRISKQEVVTQSELIDDFIGSIKEFRDTGEGPKDGIKTGLPLLDKVIGGLRGSELYIVAARTSVGKSIFALQVAQNAASQKNVGVITLEMSNKQLTFRNIAMLGKIGLSDLRDFNFSEDFDFDGLIKQSERLRKLPVFYRDSPRMSAVEFRAMARTLVKRHDCKIIIVDYMQRLHSDKKSINRWQEIAEVSWMMKTCAMELDIPIVALAQLNRRAEDHEEPELHHLREAGDLEQNADTVMLLYRTDQTESQFKDFIVPTTLKVAKQRNGACASIRLFLDAPYCRFSEREPDRVDRIGDAK